MQRLSGELSAAERKLELTAADLAAERDRVAAQAALLECKVCLWPCAWGEWEGCNCPAGPSWVVLAGTGSDPVKQGLLRSMSKPSLGTTLRAALLLSHVLKWLGHVCVRCEPCANSAARSGAGRRPTTLQLTRSQRCTHSCWQSTKTLRLWRLTSISCTLG